MRAPDFWWKSPGVVSALLSPFGAVYGAVARARLKRKGTRVGVPVICVGDPTVGGAGKTPTAIAIAKILHAMGEKPFFLTRGYGGIERGPTIFDPKLQSAQQVGDEPLLLATIAPVVISADRVAGAELASQSGASIIVMDDGFQNPALEKDLSFLVIDAGSGIGNGFVFPAGPLRAPFLEQIEHADAIILIGTGTAGEDISKRSVEKPVLRAKITPSAVIEERRVFAYAGIGRPEKFFTTLKETGCEVVETKTFPDHHMFSESEARELISLAQSQGLPLVTTEKDKVRMRGNPALKELSDKSVSLPITLHFQDEAALTTLLQKAIAEN